MFTGLVSELGTVIRLERCGQEARLQIACGFPDLSAGESIAVDGVCLTVRSFVSGGFSADVSPETLGVTTLGALRPGAIVNLERALRPTDRLGGHIVSGHIDGCGELTARHARGESTEMEFSFPPTLGCFIAEKGSMGISGVSLTVNRVVDQRFTVMIVPHTLEKTTLGTLAVGSAVNLEVDLVARYVSRFAEAMLGGPERHLASDHQNWERLLQPFKGES